MLDRAHQLIDEGVDVVAALVETHGRAETAALARRDREIPRLANGEIDLDTLMLRHPRVALIDELAHTNLSAGARAKRYDDVIAVLRGGIDVITTLNVQHFEGLGDAVERLTGTRVRETLPDSVLEFADEVVFIDVTPDVLRGRLRDGQDLPARACRCSARTLLPHRELGGAARARGARDAARALGAPPRAPVRAARPGGGAARARRRADPRAGRLARRLDVDLRVVAVTASDDPAARTAIDALAAATAAVRGTFLADVASDAALRVVETLAEGDVLAVESPRAKRRLFGARSFAVRVLAAGARELLVFAPREDDPPSAAQR